MKNGRVVWLLILVAVQGYNNGPMTKRPLLGWETWCSLGPCREDMCTEKQVRESALALKTTGLAAKGYRWVVLDNCWRPQRNKENQRLIPDKERFPSGMKALADYVHSLDLRFGLYTSAGAVTCHHHWAPGSYRHFEIDANTFADWGIDYLKVDWCDKKTRKRESHFNISRALNRTGRPIVLELCRGRYMQEENWGYAPSVAQIWRAATDHHDNFSSTLKQVFAMENKTQFSGPYGWAYGDILMTGGQGCSGYGSDTNSTHCPKQTAFEYRTEVTLYAILSSPLFIGTDIRKFTKLMADLLLNDDMLFVNQDLHAPAFVTSSCGDKAYAKRLSDNRIALAVPNFNDLHSLPRGLCTHKDDIFASYPHGTSFLLKDVWRRGIEITLSYQQNYTRILHPHDTLFCLIEPVYPADRHLGHSSTSANERSFFRFALRIKDQLYNRYVQ